MKKINFLKINFSTLNLVRKFKLYRFTKQSIIVASIIFFLLTNYLFSFITVRLDLSKNNAYTLSKSTKKIVNSLQKPVAVTLYKVDSSPATVQPIEREIIDLLKEFDRSSSNINFEIITFNIKEDKDVLEKVNNLGIAPIPVKQQGETEVSLTEIYFGISLSYNTKTELLNDPYKVEDLEYNLASTIYRLSKDKLDTVSLMGFEPSVVNSSDPILRFRQVLSSFFNVETVENEIPEDTKTLIVSDNVSSEFSDIQLQAIRNYVKSGNAIFLTDGVSINESNLQTASGEAKLHSILSDRGIIIKNNLIMSQSAEVVNLGSNQGFILPFKYYYFVKSGNFNVESPYFSSVSSIIFPWVSEITTKEVKNFEVSSIAKSSPQSWLQSSNFTLFPQEIKEPDEKDYNEFPLIAESKSKDSRIMAVASSRFFNDAQTLMSQNITFGINVLSDYASDGALNGIVKRSTQLYLLPELPKSTKEAYKYLNILFLPIIFAIYGGVRLYKRN